MADDKKDDLKEKQAKSTEEWDEMADIWDDQAAFYRDSLAERLWDYLDLPLRVERKDLVVLDFGCGTGLMTETLQPQVGQVICIDASPLMIEKVLAKIKDNKWENVKGYTAILSELEDQTEEVQSAMEELKGSVDLVLATSVLSFIPDLDGTMKVLADLLKPETGLLCHTDWPYNEEKAPNGFTDEKATKLFETAGLVRKTITNLTMTMGDEEFPVFLGVAAKP